MPGNAINMELLRVIYVAYKCFLESWCLSQNSWVPFLTKPPFFLQLFPSAEPPGPSLSAPAQAPTQLPQAAGQAPAQPPTAVPPPSQAPPAAPAAAQVTSETFGPACSFTLCSVQDALE